MKKIALIILVLILAIAGYYWYMFSKAGGGNHGPKQAPITLKNIQQNLMMRLLPP